MKELTVDYLRSILDYNPETGIFTWKVHRIGPYRKLGDTAGAINKKMGRRQLVVNRKKYLASRLAWFYTYGKWPIEIDHINRNRSDDRLANLREATPQTNKYNRTAQKNNRMGVKGVRFRWNKYHAQIGHNGKYTHLGVFNTIEEASAAYERAAREIHGEFYYKGKKK